MRGLLALMVVCVVSHCASCDEDIYTLMDKVLVLRVPHGPRNTSHVLLVCGEAYKDQDVFWKKDGQSTRYVGNQVNVTVEEMVAGNFSCHLGQDGRYLNHTLLLVQFKPDNKPILLNNISDSSDAKHILCSGHNYSGSFNCRWSKARPHATVLLVEAVRNSSAMACDLEADGLGVWCNERTCGRPEERHLIQFKLCISSNSRLEVYTAEFNLREIVSPRCVTDLREEKVNEFRWAEPEHWEEPCSYYKVQYEVKRVAHQASCQDPPLKEEAQIIDEKTFTVPVKPKKYVFCVRARDKFTGGPWGEWSALAGGSKRQGNN
ncbi:unnamed protein product [Lota lota]